MDPQKAIDVMKRCHTFKEALSKLDTNESPKNYTRLWKKACREKKIEEDDQRIKWAEDEEEQGVKLNSLQLSIYDDVIENINNKNDKIYFIVNLTKTIRRTTLKRKYGEDITPGEQEQKLFHLLAQKSFVIHQNEELIEALLKESIKRRQIGQAGCLLKNMYLHAKMRKPKIKYLSNTNKKIEVYDRIIFDLYNAGSSNKLWHRFKTILDNLLQETETPLILFCKKHFPYEELPENITPVVYEITNMYPDSIVNDITHEPAFRCLESVDIKKKSKISQRAFANRCRKRKTVIVPDAVEPVPNDDTKDRSLVDFPTIIGKELSEPVNKSKNVINLNITMPDVVEPVSNDVTKDTSLVNFPTIEMSKKATSTSTVISPPTAIRSTYCRPPIYSRSNRR